MVRASKRFESHGDILPASLVVAGLTSGWGREPVVFDVSFSIGAGTITSLLGHNGAGKTTTARTVMGVLKLKNGRINFGGVDLTDFKGPRPGMSYVPSERFSFPDLTVRENLALGTLRNRNGRLDCQKAIDEAIDWFPILAERQGQLAGTMSGGQQRMLSISMAMVSRPSLLILDEPSLGLSPRLADEVFNRIKMITAQKGLSVLLLEQNIGRALAISEQAVIVRSGRVVESVSAAQLLARGQESWWELV